MKKFELDPPEKGSFLYDLRSEDQVEDLDENIFRNFLSAIKKAASRLIKKAVNSFKKLRPGGKVTLRIPIPKNLKESAQTGKAGGELAELALLNKLHILLTKYIKKHDDIPMSDVSDRVYFNNNVDRKTWYASAYNAASETFNKSAKSASDKKEKTVWIRHGEAAAQLIFNQLKQELGDSISSVDFQMLHDGMKEIGKSKKDFSIILHKHDREKTKRVLGFSMKATLDKSPYSTPPQAYQSGYAAIVMGLISGKYTKELEDMGGSLAGYSRMVNDLEGVTDPGERKEKLAKIKASYEKTYLYELDKIGTTMGYGSSTLKGNQIPSLSNSSLLLGQYLDALMNYFQSVKKERSMHKKEHGKSMGSHENEFIVHVNDYMEIIYDVLQNEIENNEVKLIRSILKFGGIEKDLYYIAAGLSPDNPTASAAISTLFNGEWEKMRDTLLKSKSLYIETERVEKNNGINNILVKIKSNGLGLSKDWEAGTTLVRFSLYKDRQDARITLPKFFEEDNVKVGQRLSTNGKRMIGGKTVDQNSLLRKYATGKYNIE